MRRLTFDHLAAHAVRRRKLEGQVGANGAYSEFNEGIGTSVLNDTEDWMRAYVGIALFLAGSELIAQRGLSETLSAGVSGTAERVIVTLVSAVSDAAAVNALRPYGRYATFCRDKAACCLSLSGSRATQSQM